MGIIDRILLFAHAIVSAVLFLGIAALSTRLVPLDFVWTNFLYLIGRWETGAFAAVFFFVSLRLLFASLGSGTKRPREGKEAIVVRGALGEVRVAVAAVKNLADKSARSVKGVRDAKTEITVEAAKKGAAQDSAVRLKTRLVVGQESRVAEVSDQVRELLSRGMADIVGLDAVQIDVQVDDISNAPVKAQRVV